jgi:hypothetical protein
LALGMGSRAGAAGLVASAAAAVSLASLSCRQIVGITDSPPTGVDSHGLAPDEGGAPYTLDGESASDSGCGVDEALAQAEGVNPDSGMICGYTMPNPADAGLPNAASYTANPADGTVRDNVTGLIWEALVDNFAQYTQGQALAHCTNGFRLPTRIELVSLVDFTKPSPTIDGTYFMNAPAQRYWTSSHFVCDPNTAYYVGFDQSGTHPTYTSYQYYARCVKGAPSNCAPTHYQIQPDGSVLDRTTGLTWQRNVAPPKLSWSDALTSCPLGWRLPSVNELQTIVDQNRQSPPIDPVAFPGTPSEDFWTSSAKAGDPTPRAWYVAFIHGHADTDLVSSNFWVRCVR